MTRKRTTEQIAKGATNITLDLVLPCGCPVKIPLVHTGLGSHVAVISAKDIPHSCAQTKRLPAWELHIWKYMTEQKFKRFGYAQIDLITGKDESCH